MVQGAEPAVVHVSEQAMLRSAVNNAATSGVPTVIIFENDITLTVTALTIPRNADVTLQSNVELTSVKGVEFFRLNGASDKNTILVDGGGVLKLDGIIVTHASGNGRGVEISFSGTLELRSGKISGNTLPSSTGGGGGVFNRGTFKMSGGMISDNLVTSGGNGGGVYNSDGTFILTAGLISNNRATSHGGGVYSTGIFSMRGGEISSNTLTNSDGSGVYNTGNFVFEAGVISNNKAPRDGGGVFNSGTFTMSGGVVSNNTASSDGGGVYSTGSSLKLSGCVISGNTASSRGGGMYSSAGSFELSACEIFNNIAATGGGIWRSGAFNMSNVIVSSNHASNVGGGVYKYDGGSNFTMYGGKISGNTADGTNGGGGVYINNGNFELRNGGVISDNRAQQGGGVCLLNGLVHLYSGKISCNYANIGGGICVTTDSRYLDRLIVEADVEFSCNRATRGYDRLPADDARYSNQIKGVVWSDPFKQGYNNYDISYVHGSPLTEFTVTVEPNTNPPTPKWLTYISNGTIRATVHIDAGIPPVNKVFDEWVANSKDVIFNDPKNPHTTFTMPEHPVEITPTWTDMKRDFYTVTYHVNGGAPVPPVEQHEAGDIVTVTS
ncbi:MAG: hypothetical protein FWF66_05220, partial [Candidatus Bathyarchaeota archaeon]|nr:hypothetical protein [Candidatus Termiticorpusculum sp.]